MVIVKGPGFQTEVVYLSTGIDKQRRDPVRIGVVFDLLQSLQQCSRFENRCQ